MTTTATSRRAERTFFVTVAVCLGGFVLIGFWRSYFQPGAPVLPSLLVHIHAVLMVGWIALVLCQVGLISTRKVRWHQRLGIAMGFWALAILIVAPVTAIAALRRPGSGVVARGFWADGAELLAFALLSGLALLRRRKPPEHTRLMLLGTAVIMLPAIARWPFDFMQKGPPIGIWAIYFAAPVALVVYDLVTLRKVHRMTVLGSVAIAVVACTTMTIPSTAWWQSITARVQRG
jgi:FtsH-binding integral membrane protein